MKRRKPNQASPLMPERIGRYDVLLPVASGGMGTVYLAKSHGLGGFERDVALKVMHAHLREEDAFAHDLIEEAKLAGRIKHPNVVQVLDVGEDPHGVYLVMEYVEGDTLAGLRRSLRKDAGKDVRLDPRIGLRILVDALRGLHAAHELLDDDGQPIGLVHRDFSPQNILVGVDGVSRLTDFGVAKARTRLTHTATGLIKGKIHYMSPEQAKTEPIDRRSDVWAAGVIAWELLAGRNLYKERTDTGILLALVTQPAPRLRTVDSKTPKALDEAVAYALTGPVEQRCPNALELAQALEDGATAVGGLASIEEVSSYVKEVAGPHLSKRREHIAEVRKLREEMSTIALDATTTDEQTTPSTAGLSNLEPRHEDDDTLEMTDPIGDKKVAADERPVEAASDEPSVTEISQSLSLRPARARSTSNRSRAIVVVASAVVGAGVAAWALGGDERPVAQTPSASVAAASAAANDVEPVASAAPTPTEPPSAASESADAVSTEIAVSANVAMRELRIGQRSVAVEPASTTVKVALAEDEQKGKLIARSVDGRLAAVNLKGGEREIALQFGPPRASGPRPPSTSHKPAPLAPSPYDQ